MRKKGKELFNVYIVLIYFLKMFNYMSGCRCVHMCVLVPSETRKRESEPLELILQAVKSCLPYIP